MPVALAMLATERSISAHRITNVRPTAIMPVTEICVRMFCKLPKVAKEALAVEKNPTSSSSVAKGAMLRNCPRSQFGMILLSRDFEQPVLADRFVGKLPHHSALFHDQDAIGERQHRFWFAGNDDDRDPLFTQATHDLQDVVLGAHVHAPCRLTKDQHPRQIGQPFRQRDFLLVAA